MIDFPEAAWVAMGLVAASAVLGMLYAAAGFVRNHVLAEDLRRRVHDLKAQYARRSTEVETMDVDILTPVPAKKSRKAA